MPGRGVSGTLHTHFAAALAGLAVALLTSALFFAVGELEAKKEARLQSMAGLERVQANLDNLGEQLFFFADQGAIRLSGTSRGSLGEMVERLESMWPGADFSLYDAQGEFLPELSGKTLEAAPVPRTSRPLVYKALAGKFVRDVTRSRGFLSLSVAVPMHHGSARVLVVSLPLEQATIELIARRAAAQVAVIPSDDLGDGALDFSLAAGSMSRTETLWRDISSVLPEYVPDRTGTGDAGQGRFPAFAPLNDGEGNRVGLLLALPARVAAHGINWLHAAIALIAGLGTALVCNLALKRHAAHMGLAFSGSVMALAEAEGDSGAVVPGALPAPLQVALARVSKVLRDYKKRLHSAEMELGASGRQAVPDRKTAFSQREDDYLRLFENAPIGVFQAEAAGPFVRVNQAFAMLLGFDTPMQLMTENISFTDFCLYGDEIRNPLIMLSEQGGGRQVISLRRRDGGIGSYVLLCVPLTASSGERSTVLEGFLLDRSLEDQIARAEREREGSSRQRTSLALLLAATCRQTQSYLSLPRPGRAPARDGKSAAFAAPAEARVTAVPLSEADACPERGPSAQTVKSFLADIYQVAMGEAVGSPPVDVPMDFARFLNRLCRLAQPFMLARGVSLHCEASPDVLGRMAGPAPMLRHALHRALLAVIAPVREGWASLHVMRDPNAPRSPGISRVLFTVSWSRHAAADRAGSGLESALRQSGKNDVEVFRVQVDPDSANPDCAAPDVSTLEIADEQEVLRFLVGRMRGELLEGFFDNNFRSLQFVVHLGHLADHAADASPEAPDMHEAAPALVPESLSGRDDFELSAMSTEGLVPLSTLVSEQISEDDAPLERDSSRHGLNILLVDDSLNNRLLFSLFLRDTQHRITEAHDGQEGVEAFRRGRFDVIFMDMEMPLMDGYQATRIIRAIEADSGRMPTPIVGMTSYALPEFRRQCILSGCTDFLSKPFSKIALFAILDAFEQIKADAQPSAAHERAAG
jgi:CheY-like chemotaxis protein/PAS domain-containing protein